MRTVKVKLETRRKKPSQFVPNLCGGLAIIAAYYASGGNGFAMIIAGLGTWFVVCVILGLRRRG